MKNEKKLKELIDNYAKNKELMESQKKTVDSFNLEIKKIMLEMKQDSFETDNYNATVSKSVKTTMDEDKLLEVLKHNNITNAIRTKEYVDLDLLENMMYHNEIPQDVIVQMGDCKSEKEVITLRVSKRK